MSMCGLRGKGAIAWCGNPFCMSRLVLGDAAKVNYNLSLLQKSELLSARLNQQNAHKR